MNDLCGECGQPKPAEPHDTCVDCGAELRFVFDGNNPQDSRQYNNALPVTLTGGYGMFFDDIDTGDRTFFLCHECAHRLCEQIPWLGQLIDPLKSHSHRPEYWAANPDHEGWDKK